MAARDETLRLFRSFLRLRHQFPNKQGRSKLRRWTCFFFALNHLQYQRTLAAHGPAAADRLASQWRSDARQDLGKLFSAPLPMHPLLASPHEIFARLT